MVYCTKCGTLNPEEAVNCSNCGAPLLSADRPYARYGYQRSGQGIGPRRGGSGMGLLIGGIIVILLGVAFLTNSFALFWQLFWPAIIIIIGVWLVARGLMRNRRYRQTPA